MWYLFYGYFFKQTEKSIGEAEHKDTHAESKTQCELHNKNFFDDTSKRKRWRDYNLY